MKLALQLVKKTYFQVVSVTKTWQYITYFTYLWMCAIQSKVAKCTFTMQCINDDYTDLLTDCRDDLMDNRIDYALLGICNNNFFLKTENL